MAGPEAATGHAEIAGERRQASDGTTRLPSVRAFAHRAPTQDDHRWLRGRITPGERRDTFGVNACNGRRRRWRMALHVRRELVEPDSVLVDERPIDQLLADDHVHHRKCERRIRARPDDQHFVRVAR